MKLFGIHIDTHKVADQALKLAITVGTVAIMHKAVTGKLDIKAAAVEVARGALGGGQRDPSVVEVVDKIVERQRA